MRTANKLMYMADFYKVSHKLQYPNNVTKVHSVLTARSINYNPEIDQSRFMWFGVKLYIQKLNDFSDWFFNLAPDGVEVELQQYKEFLDTRLGGDNCIDHWRRLFLNGSLPIQIHAIDERSICDLQKPLLTVENTHNDFYWLTSFIETSLLSNLWATTTAANRAWNIRSTIEGYFSNHTEDERLAIDFMAHDFSYRGMVGDDASILMGCGHLANFKGSDTIPAIRAMEDVYGEITGFSVPATEHSVMCAGGKESELDTYNRILDIYPEGIVSIVSDTWDYYSVLENTLPKIKDKIMARDGKLVIRPDSGDPVKIICGGDGYKSSLDILAEIFGTTKDSQGLLVLDQHIGLIYGDGMNQARIDEMLRTMVGKGYSPLNIVFGIGAYTYQLMTRDELGMAFKATAVERDGEWVDIQKDPATDSGKKSLTGRFTTSTNPELKRVY